MPLEFDKTRDAIGIGHMSNAEREAMFRKFKDSGGEVLDEHGKKKERQKQKRKPDQKIKPSRESLPSKSFSSPHIQEKNSGFKKVRHPEIPKRNFSDLIFLYSKCFFLGLTNISCSKVKKKFLLTSVRELQRYLQLFRNHLNECILGRGENISELLEALDGKDPLSIEILNYMYELYDASDFDLIENIININVKRDVPLEHISNSIKNIYQKLYHLRAYQKMSVKTVNEFFNLYTRSREPTQNSLNFIRKEMLAGLRMVFYHLQNFYLLICCDEKAIFDEDSDSFKAMIGFDETRIIGMRSRGEPHRLANLVQKEYSFDIPVEQENEVPADMLDTVEESTVSLEKALDETPNETDYSDQESAIISPSLEENEEKEENEENTEAIIQTKEYKYGMSLMKKRTPDHLRKKFYDTKYLDALADFDKVFLAYKYYQEFDYEYSFVMTTKQIHFEIIYSYGVKTDYTKILADLYAESRGIEKSFEKYCILLKDLEVFQENSVDNYIERSKKKSMFDSKIEAQGNTTRSTISQFLGKVVSNLVFLITDMKEKKEKSVIGNMNQPVYFQGNIEGEKKLNGKTVVECITEAYCYALALKHRVEKGDFHEGMQMNENEIKESFGEEYYQSYTQQELA